MALQAASERLNERNLNEVRMTEEISSLKQEFELAKNEIEDLRQ